MKFMIQNDKNKLVKQKLKPKVEMIAEYKVSQTIDSKLCFSSSCIHYAASFSRWSFFDCPLSIL